jgi:hypothetical protein
MYHVLSARQTREVAGWFLHRLLDGDPASKHLSWQWVASSFSLIVTRSDGFRSCANHPTELRKYARAHPMEARISGRARRVVMCGLQAFDDLPDIV